MFKVLPRPIQKDTLSLFIICPRNSKLHPPNFLSIPNITLSGFHPTVFVKLLTIMPHIILIGTLDSKLDEFLYLRSQLLECSTYASTPLKITTIDCGRTSTQNEDISITQAQLVQKYGSKENIDISTLDRGGVIRYMIGCAIACVKDLVSKGEVHGILSAGGSGGTSLVSAVMRAAAPMGMPKLIVSTVALGDTGPIVGETDITLMYSVVDITGMNTMLRDVLSNAAGAMMGMSTAYESNLTRRTKLLEMTILWFQTTN
jgi:uncharacterized protein (UPF0261 family)